MMGGIKNFQLVTQIIKFAHIGFHLWWFFSSCCNIKNVRHSDIWAVMSFAAIFYLDVTFVVTGFFIKKRPKVIMGSNSVAMVLSMIGIIAIVCLNSGEEQTYIEEQSKPRFSLVLNINMNQKLLKLKTDNEKLDLLKRKGKFIDKNGNLVHVSTVFDDECSASFLRTTLYLTSEAIVFVLLYASMSLTKPKLQQMIFPLIGKPVPKEDNKFDLFPAGRYPKERHYKKVLGVRS